ncbi:MAG: transporter [[Candidatus Thermochlorobacteriaceae] bacterium GBChlB]|nr:MAG: transporter [[Candidatus Thermochlorobacteriaceae] bacterium GBChlB]
MVRSKSIRFNRNEWGGAFGDIGTDFPLLVGMILAARLDAASVLVAFGAMQILTGVVYKLPMPVQPLKAVAVIVITQKLGGEILFGGGLAIGLLMLLLTLTGALEFLATRIPKAVVRGLQLGLGVQLGMLALKDYVPTNGIEGYALAAVAFVIILFLIGKQTYPAAVMVIAGGVVLTLVSSPEPINLIFSVSFPKLHAPTPESVWNGLILLALPQISLSLGNSILATKHVANDLFPERNLTVSSIGITYSLMNLISPFVSGAPVCHGAGGMAGHAAFGARTGGSVMLYGAFYLLLGIFFAQSFESVVKFFPLPILGVILFFEAVSLIKLTRDAAESTINFTTAIFVALLAMSLPYGFLVGLVVGTAAYELMKRGMTKLDS